MRWFSLHCAVVVVADVVTLLSQLVLSHVIIAVLGHGQDHVQQSGGQERAGTPGPRWITKNSAL
jgi:hypothetical protein